MKRDYKVVMLPDTQVPYHDAAFVKAMTLFVRDFKPEVLAHVGDHLDAPEPSRWNKGMAGEYAPTLQKSIRVAHDMLAEFSKAAPDARKILKMGNHDERVQTYVHRYAPALGSLDALQYESLLRTEDIGWEVAHGLVDLAPGWVLAHGHESGLNSTAGGTALGLARKIGKSVVCGHTHKAGLQSDAFGYNGNITQLFGMEVGHAMDIRKAAYLKYGGAKWTQAFGILNVEGKKVKPELVIVQGKSFTVHGVTYAW